MVVAIPEMELLEIIVDTRTNRVSLSKVHGGTLNGLRRTIGDSRLIGRQVGVGVQRQQVITNGGVTLARQVKVGVVGKVQDGNLIGSGL